MTHFERKKGVGVRHFLNPILLFVILLVILIPALRALPLKIGIFRNPVSGFGIRVHSWLPPEK
jgi:hypothetical protein